jgi:WD domain, G-beta repeat
MEGSQSSTGKTGVWQRVFDLFFGYDYFIAHRSVDGKLYAAALYDALRAEGNELDCFLDVKHYSAVGRLPWMQSRALNKTSRLIVISTEHAHDLDAHYLQGEIRQFRRYHPNGVIVSVGSRRTLSRQFFAESTLLPIIPNLDREDIVILEEEADLLAGKVSPNTLAKLLNDFGEQRTSAKRLKWIKGIAVVMFLLALTAVGFWWRATNAQHAAEEQARIAESRRLAAESTSSLTKYPQRSVLLAVEAVKAEQPLHGVRLAADEQSLRQALGFIGGRLVARGDLPITIAAISPDNRWVATGSDDKTARLWDLSAKDPTANPVVLRGHDGVVNAMAISPDNRWVVTGSDDKTVRLWDLSAKDPAANPVVLRGHDGPVFAVAISPDNRWLVTGSDDKTARLWDLSAKDPAANPVVLRGHEGPVFAVAISPDSHWLVTGSTDSTARLWDLSAKDPAAIPVVLRGHDEGLVNAVAISPDNRWIVTTGSYDGTARLWLLQMKDLMHLARTMVRRNFSADEWRLYFPGKKYRKTFDELPGLDESVTQKNN